MQQQQVQIQEYHIQVHAPYHPVTFYIPDDQHTAVYINISIYQEPQQQVIHLVAEEPDPLFEIFEDAIFSPHQSE